MLGRILDALHTNLSVLFLEFRLLVAGDFGGRGVVALDIEIHFAVSRNRPCAIRIDQSENL